MDVMGPNDGGLGDLIDELRKAVGQVIVGKEASLELLLVALLCRGHALLEDVPGVGKTLLARTLAAALGCQYRRLQMTADVLPSDVTGSSIFNQRTAEFEFRPGPIFTQLLLADEINRATPRTQSALLEAMEERQVTVDGATRPLPGPFFVLATENPIELEGTFPLPEAQLDRFLVRVGLGYPSLQEEHAILQRFERAGPVTVKPVVAPEQILSWQDRRGEIVVSEVLRSYLLEIVRVTRSDERITLGASPRAALALLHAIQARAVLLKRDYAVPDDVKTLAVPVLAHRLVLSPSSRLRGLTAPMIIEELLATIAVPVEADGADRLDT